MTTKYPKDSPSSLNEPKVMNNILWMDSTSIHVTTPKVSVWCYLFDLKTPSFANGEYGERWMLPLKMTCRITEFVVAYTTSIGSFASPYKNHQLKRGIFCDFVVIVRWKNKSRMQNFKKNFKINHFGFQNPKSLYWVGGGMLCFWMSQGTFLDQRFHVDYQMCTEFYLNQQLQSVSNLYVF